MSLPRKNFTSKLKNKNAYTYTSKLNYKLKKYQERADLVKKILEKDDFYVEYFDKYFKSSVNHEEFLSFDNNICKSLEQMANYLLLSSDIEENLKENDKEWKTKYVFYTDKALGKKIDKDYNKREETIMFLVDKNRNYRVEVKQKIFDTDFYDSDFDTEVKIYQEDSPDKYYTELSNYLKNISNMSSELHKKMTTDKTLVYKVKSKLKEWMKENKADLVLTKDKIKGTIYYNHCLPESTEINWFLINFTDQEQVLNLLKVWPRDLMTDLGIIIYDLNQLLKQVKLNEFEEEVIELWRREDYTQEVIADILGVSQQFISATLKNISRKIVNQYKDNYEDWIYLNWKKGNYKKCNGCGQVRLTSKFYKKEDNKDGFHKLCKLCIKAIDDLPNI